MVEGAPLLREYRRKTLIEGSNPSLSAIMESWLFNASKTLNGIEIEAVRNPDFRSKTRESEKASFITARLYSVRSLAHI